MLSEAEDLLVKAWTSQDVEHEGRFWKASFPVLRPRPYQKPHPPLARACISDESIVDMANIGRPILMSVQPLDALRYKLQLYRDTMLGAGYAEPQVERALDETWVMKCMYLTDSDGEAEETATRAPQEVQRSPDSWARTVQPRWRSPMETGATSTPHTSGRARFLGWLTRKGYVPDRCTEGRRRT